MPKLIPVTELQKSYEEENAYETRWSFWLNSDQIFRVYSTKFETVDGGGPKDGSTIIFINESVRLSVLETPEQIVALIEGRPFPKAPTEERAATKIVLANPIPVASGQDLSLPPNDAI